MFYQGPQGDRGERGESGDPGYKVRSISPGGFKVIHLGIWDHEVNILQLFSQGQVGVDGERGRSGAPGQPVSVKTCDLYTVLSLSLHKQPAGTLTQFVFICFH